MPSTTLALRAEAAGGSLKVATINRRTLGPHDVRIDVQFVGICHTDIHQVNDDWGGAIFPMVPGHEIAGFVAEVGTDVTRYAVGDRVGVGCFVDSCGECEYCLRGDEQLCIRDAIQTYNYVGYDGETTLGGYSRSIVVSDRFVLSIPEGLDLAAAAPLLCAGITVYSPLVRYGVADKNIAIIGMGGLGHVAVKIASKLGAKVTVLSQTLSKREDGLAFGAQDYQATGEPGAFDRMNARFDLILNTVGSVIPLDDYLPTLKVDGTFVNVGFPAEPYSFHAASIVMKQQAIVGSNVGGIARTQEMLDFCAAHDVAAEIELIGIDGIPEAYERILSSDVRYRFVIDIANTLNA